MPNISIDNHVSDRESQYASIVQENSHTLPQLVLVLVLNGSNTRWNYRQLLIFYHQSYSFRWTVCERASERVSDSMNAHVCSDAVEYNTYNFQSTDHIRTRVSAFSAIRFNNHLHTNFTARTYALFVSHRSREKSIKYRNDQAEEMTL